MCQRHRFHVSRQRFPERPHHASRSVHWLNAALVQEAGFVPPLCGAGNLPAGEQNIVLNGVFKTRIGFLWSRTSGERRVSDRRSERFVDHAITFQRTEPGKRMSTRHNERVGEVVAMRHDSSACPASHRFAFGPRALHFSPPSEISEGHCRPRPAINAQHRSTRREQQCLIDRHIQRGGVWLWIENLDQVIEDRAVQNPSRYFGRTSKSLTASKSSGTFRARRVSPGACTFISPYPVRRGLRKTSTCRPRVSTIQYSGTPA